MTANPAPKGRGYSRTWARYIVETYMDHHARAADLAWGILRISTDQLANLIIDGGPGWDRFKAYVKTWEKLPGSILGLPRKDILPLLGDLRREIGLPPEPT